MSLKVIQLDGPHMRLQKIWRIYRRWPRARVLLELAKCDLERKIMASPERRFEVVEVAPDDDQIYLSSAKTEQLVLPSSVSADTRMRRA